MTRTLWTSADAEAATGGRGTRPWRATGVSIDSRTLAPGDIFVALAGERGDGHTHVAAALAGGAAAALVTRRPDDVAADAPLLVVPDTLEALTRLGLAARARATATRGVAVTGSVGKTGTKDALQFLMTREITHMKAFAAALESLEKPPFSIGRIAPSAAVVKLTGTRVASVVPSRSKTECCATWRKM